MQRICATLAANGFKVTLTGRKLPASVQLKRRSFHQKRLYCFFTKGFLFYAEYNLRLFCWLLFTRADIICAIDLDTIMPCFFASVLKQIPRVYDAHELFTEQKEIVTRPPVHKFWLWVERFAVPRFTTGYTVNTFIAAELERRYGVHYSIVRNLPVYNVPIHDSVPAQPPFIIYQGAVNEGRSFETLIPAMRDINAKLVICGKGNFFEQTKQLVLDYGVEDKVHMKGYVEPDMLKTITPVAYAAVTLFEQTGLNQVYSLSNRFFDYIMAGVPQVCVNYPEYKAINDRWQVALMIDDTSVETIAAALNRLLLDHALYEQLRKNCVIAREVLNWGAEEKQLVEIYHQL